jgi:long-chain acyl-CoA synthetase
MRHVAIDPSKLALQQLYRWEQTAPQRVVLTQPMGGGRIQEFTWAQVMDSARRLAAWLQAQGLQPGDRVALISKNTAWWLMADFSIWLAGGVSVPLYPTLAADTITQVLQHSQARWLFIGKLDGWAGMRPGVEAAMGQGLQCIRMPLAPAMGELPPASHDWDAITASTAPLAGNPLRDGDELATIMYTSGTTGAPKGVMHSFATFAWSIESGLQRLSDITPEARMLSYLPLSHVAERTLIEHGLLFTSMHVFFAESLDTFTQDLQRARPTVFFSVPRLWVKFQQGVQAKMPPAKLQRLLRIPIIRGIVRKKILGALGLDQCTFAAGGAAPMPPALLNWFAQLGLPIVEVYGMTENCGVSHATLKGVQRPGTVGKTYQGVSHRIDPANGEIQVKSEGLMLGYYKEPQLTADAFTEDGWLHTGDKGAIDADGYLKITGRVKDLFKTSKGKYVAPAPIEDKLVVHPAVEACCVTGANLGQPLAVLMLNQDAITRSGDAAGRAELEASLAAHRQAVNATLDPHEQLDSLILVTEPWTVDNGFITPTFKVKRNRVEEIYGPRYDAWADSRQGVIWADR